MTGRAELLRIHVHEVFGNRDAASRRDAMQRIYSADGVFTEPGGTLTGHDALDTCVNEFLTEARRCSPPSRTGRRTSPTPRPPSAGVSGPSRAEPGMRGRDILTIDGGTITMLRTMIAS